LVVGAPIVSLDYTGNSQKGYFYIKRHDSREWEYYSKIQSHIRKYVPPNDAATATEPATCPAAVAAAANPLAPITGIRVPKVGAKAPSPAAIAGAANPV